MQIGKQHLTGTFIVVDILSKHPLLGRDLFTEMGITMDTMLNQEPLETLAVQQKTTFLHSTMTYLKRS